MRRLLPFLGLLAGLLFPAAVSAATISATLTQANPVASLTGLDPSSVSSCLVAITATNGGASGTVTFQATGDTTGTAWVSQNLYAFGDASFAAVTSTATTGIWNGPCALVNGFRAILLAPGSGSSVKLRITTGTGVATVHYSQGANSPFAIIQPSAIPTVQGGYIGAINMRLSGLTVGTNVCVDANKVLTSSGCAGGGSVVGITAGTNIVVTTPNPNSPTVSATAAPTFDHGIFSDSTGTAAYRVSVIGGNGLSNLLMESTATAAPAAAGSNINWINTNNQGGVPSAEIWSGLGGATAANYGGYIVLGTRGDGAGSAISENLVADHNGHLSVPQTALTTTIASPSSCAALTACGTATYSFTKPFTTPSGGAENARCTGLLIQDTTTAGDIWIGSIQAVSSTAVTFNYAPLLTISGAKSLVFTFACWDSAY